MPHPEHDFPNRRQPFSNKLVVHYVNSWLFRDPDDKYNPAPQHDKNEKKSIKKKNIEKSMQ